MTRELTSTKLLAMMDDGTLTAEAIVRACMAYMSEDDIKDMAENEGLIDVEDEEEIVEDEESDDDTDEDEDEDSEA
jgi:Asp-tRNA(Asn)/Glu-tRNA(Gln) amidotransferase B subunit